MLEANSRVVIDSLRPNVDEGQFPIKRGLEEFVHVEAVLLCDGHDTLKGDLLYRHEHEEVWQRVPLRSLGNDVWGATFEVKTLGVYYYTVQASVDAFQTLAERIRKRLQARESASNELDALILLLGQAIEQLEEPESAVVQRNVENLRKRPETAALLKLLHSKELKTIMHEVWDTNTTLYSKKLEVRVEPAISSCGAWYEFFPRSNFSNAANHGTLNDAHAMLGHVASLGFDVVYLPPIHPIGQSYRKGKNGILPCETQDVGSPWAIGDAEGGHKSICSKLGTLQNFQSFLQKASALKLNIALDLALQCSPDHPYVKEHPEWFKRNADESFQYAENPPKKYQDIVPFDFECPDREALFAELKSIVVFWIEQGIRIFRVDNPHTKPFYFWDWLIASVKREFPDVIFLAEAFAKPHVMYRLAKLGFSQSYTYFTWRNTKVELEQYLTELTQTPLREFFRPHFWPNTPDILPEALQGAPRSAFIARFVLAATLSANYGVYGPAFELCQNQPRDDESEEYADSEKYELKRWNLKDPNSIAPLIAHVNQIRREHSALQSNKWLRFLPIDNDHLLAFQKQSPDGQDALIVIINLDPNHKKSGTLTLELESLGLEPSDTYQMHDLMSDTRVFWQGSANIVEIDPTIMPAQIYALRRKTRSEREFDYYV